MLNLSIFLEIKITLVKIVTPFPIPTVMKYEMLVLRVWPLPDAVKDHPPTLICDPFHLQLF